VSYLVRHIGLFFSERLYKPQPVVVEEFRELKTNHFIYTLLSCSVICFLGYQAFSVYSILKEVKQGLSIDCNPMKSCQLPDTEILNIYVQEQNRYSTKLENLYPNLRVTKKRV